MEEDIKFHALEFFKQLSRYLSENSIIDLNRYLKEYQNKYKNLYFFKYRDEIERNLLATYLIQNDIIELKEVVKQTGDKFYTLTENGKKIMIENKKSFD